MADRTESSVEVAASPNEVLAVIADFESYPQWAASVKEATVVDAGAGARAVQVQFTLDAGVIKDTYTLVYDWHTTAKGTGTVSWQLLTPSAMLRALDGSYVLAAATKGVTLVTYTLAVDVRIPMLGMLRRKAERVLIDTALNELKKRVES